MRATLFKLWPVFASVVLIQLANGIQSDLVGVRASLEHFPAWTLGPMLACYYVGYSTAPLVSRRIIARFGHGLAVASSAVLAGIVMLAHAFLIAPAIWAFFRFAIGFSFSLGYVGFESFINDHVDNTARGRVFSTYTLTQLVAMTAAQAIFGAGDPRTVWLFAIAAALLVAGAIPFGATFAHDHDKPPPEPLHIGDLFRVAPLGALTTIVAGISWSIIITFGPIYALRAGLSQAELGIFMGASMAGGMLAQFPLGWLSDHFGRRPTLAVMAVGAIAAALAGVWAGQHSAFAQYAVMLLTGGFVFTLYAIAVSSTNDHVAPQNRVAAAAGLVMLFGLGSITGPLIGGFVFAHFGAQAFFPAIAAIMTLSLAATAVTR